MERVGMGTSAMNGQIPPPPAGFVMQGAPPPPAGFQTQGPSREQLSQAFYDARDSGDQDGMKRAAQAVHAAGFTLAPMNAQQLDAASATAGKQVAAENSPLQNFTAGIGHSFVNAARGVGQLVGVVSPEQAHDAKVLDTGLMGTTAGTLGDITGQGVQMAALGGVGGVAAKGLGVAAKALPFVESGIGAGAVAGLQPVTGDESHVKNALVGAGLGLAGQGITNRLGALATRAAPALSDAKQAAIQTLRDAGVPLHFSNLTDSKFGQYAASAANSLPFSGGAASGAAQQDAFNAAVAKTFGSETKSISPSVINDATKRIGNGYNQLFARNTVKIDDAAQSQLMDLAQKAATDLSPDQSKVVINQIGKFVQAAQRNGGEIPGRLYQNIRSELGSLESSPTHGFLVRKVRQAMQDIANRSFGSDDAAELAALNGQYANLQVTKKALGRVAGANHDIQPSSLWSFIKTKYGATPEMRALAQAGQVVLKDNARDSGTAIRNQIYRAIVPAGVAGTFGGLPAALTTLGAMGATGATAGRFLNSELAGKVLPGLTGRTLNGLSKIARPAPYVIPAIANQ